MELEFWRNYRKTTGELTWRLAAKEDEPAIERLCRVSERLLGRKQRRPDLFAFPVLIALVAENPQGKVVDLVYLEAQVELVKMGLTKQVYVEGHGIEDDLRAWLRSIGFRKALITTAHDLKERMKDGLKAIGFNCVDGILSYWVRHF